MQVEEVVENGEMEELLLARECVCSLVLCYDIAHGTPGPMR